MKKQLFAAFLIIVLAFALCTGCSKTNKDNGTQTSTSSAAKTKDTAPSKITLNEVAHSVFYATLYVAIEKGYFQDEKIDLTLVTGFGDDA